MKEKEKSQLCCVIYRFCGMVIKPPCVDQEDVYFHSIFIKWRQVVVGWNRDQRVRKKPRGLPWWLSGKESNCHAGDTGSIPHAVWQLSPCATVIEVRAPQSLCPETREVTARRSLHTTTKSSPHSLQLKSPRMNEDPAQPKINVKIPTF